jgi:hypothetical protein
MIRLFLSLLRRFINWFRVLRVSLGALRVSLSDIGFASLLGRRINVFLRVDGHLARYVIAVSYLYTMLNSFIESGRYNNR